jgi:multidrug efflux pump subunit AcrA (membrane-fusion protein)
MFTAVPQPRPVPSTATAAFGTAALDPLPDVPSSRPAVLRLATPARVDENPVASLPPELEAHREHRAGGAFEHSQPCLHVEPNANKRMLKVVMPLAIVALGIATASVFIANRPQAASSDRPEKIPHVRVRHVEAGSHRPAFSALGIVRPETQVVLHPEVTGRVVEQHEQLVAGGHIRKNEALIRVDPRDYSDAVAIGQAEVEQARLMAIEERARKQVAEHEWKYRPEGISEDSLDFALRQPHVRAARARVRSARSRVKRAQRDLQRTIVRAPFDAVVLEEGVDIGQMVGPQSNVATLVGIERYLLQVSVPAAWLPLIAIPGLNVDHETGSQVEIVSEQGVRSGRAGRVVRLLNAVDRDGQMAQLVVAVEDPLGLVPRQEGDAPEETLVGDEAPVRERVQPLLLGRYMSVVIEGNSQSAVIALPSASLHGNEVFVVDEEDRLRKRTVRVAWRERDEVFVDAGLSTGDRVVITPFATAADGMRVVVDSGQSHDD